MLAKFARLASLASLLFLVFAGTVHALPPILEYDSEGNIVRPVCATEDIWELKKADRGLQRSAMACATEGACDDPVTRDGTDNSGMAVNVIVHVMNNSDGTPPDGVTQTTVNDAMNELALDYANHNISFNLAATRFHNDANYYCIQSYNFGGGWLNDINSMKQTYAEDPANNINIFVSCQDQGGFGTLLGIGTFPWDPDADTALGGLWVNSRFFGAGNKTLSHEMGHNLGLWHTHHGVSETSGCSDECTENVHSPTDSAADYVGDFCKDTPPTPTNYDCVDPSGTDCNNVSWGDTDESNIMGYGPDSCVDHFSGEQGLRMHCWTTAALPGVVGGGSSCTETAPSAPSSLSATSVSDSQVDLAWADNSGNEDGFTIERDSGSGFAVIATVGSNVTSFSDTGLGCETSYSYQVKATNCGGDSGYSNIASATTGTCPAGPTMHVSSIDLATRSRGPWTNADGYVTVVDGSGSAVGGAVVTASWSGSSSSTQSVTTGSDGRAFFESGRLRNASSYCWTLTVDDVSLSGATYDAAANVETSDSVGNACGSARLAEAGARFHGNQPNPFNPSTTFHFALEVAGEVELRVVDASGRVVRELVAGELGAGEHSVYWDGKDATGRAVASGVYFATFQAGDVQVTHRTVLLK